MTRRFQISFHGLILLTLIPVLTVITAIMCFWAYRTIYDVILNGFDRKLLAVTSITGALSSAEDQLELLRPVAIDVLWTDLGATPRVFGFESGRQALYRLRSDGAAEFVTNLPVVVTAVAPHPTARACLGLTEGGASLVEMQLGSWQLTYTNQLAGGPFTGLALWDGRVITTGGGRLYEVSLETGFTRSIGEAPFENVAALTTGLTTNGGPVTVWALEEKSGRVAQFVSNAWSILPNPSELPPTPPEALVFNPWNPSTLLAAAGSPHVWDPAEPGFRTDRETYREGFRDRESARYLRNAEPLQKIRKQKNVTYLYTQILLPSEEVAYIMDATTPEDDLRTPIGWADPLPELNLRRARELMGGGPAYVLPVVNFPGWGLIKSAVAPMWDANGKVVMMAGSDIDVSVIKEKTRVASLTVVGIGLATLLIAGLTSVGVASALVRPIEAIKRAALLLAAGRHETRIQLTQPDELVALGTAFNTLGERLQRTMGSVDAPDAAMPLPPGTIGERLEVSPNIVVESSSPACWVQSKDERSLVVWWPARPADRAAHEEIKSLAHAVMEDSRSAPMERTLSVAGQVFEGLLRAAVLIAPDGSVTNLGPHAVATSPPDAAETTGSMKPGDTVTARSAGLRIGPVQGPITITLSS